MVENGARMMANSNQACRLYLKLPAQPSNKAMADLEHLSASTAIACVLLGRTDATADHVQLSGLLRRTLAQDVPLLVENDIELALKLDTDGVHLDADMDGYKAARARLGPAAIVGVDCGKSRHAAMT